MTDNYKNRIKEFCRQWYMMSNRGDGIYSVHADCEAEMADLNHSDLLYICNSHDELLEALEDAHEYINVNVFAGCANAPRYLEKVKAAIAKAKGQEQ